MSTIYHWTIDLKDEADCSYFYDDECHIDFSHTVDGEGNIEITVDGFINGYGAYFSTDAELSCNTAMKMIYLAAADHLENDDAFCEACRNIVEDEYKPIGFSSNNPDATIVRRVS